MRMQMQKKDAAKAVHLRRLNPAKRDSFSKGNTLYKPLDSFAARYFFDGIEEICRNISDREICIIKRHMTFQ